MTECGFYFNKKPCGICVYIDILFPICKRKLPYTPVKISIHAEKNGIHAGKKPIHAGKNPIHAGKNGIHDRKNDIHGGKKPVLHRFKESIIDC